MSLLNINPEISGASAAHRFSARYTYLANSNIHRAEYRQPSSPHSHKRYRYTHTGACTERSRSNNRNQLTGANYNYLSGSTWTNSNEFDVTGLSYDRDGNIQALSRRFEGLKTYSYSYTSGTNRLASVNKNGSNISFGYDGNGNITTIGTGYSITGTAYNWSNLPTAITKSGTTYNYRYDHAGLRVYKQEGDNIHTLRGAFGEVLATYKNGSLDYWNIVRPDGAVIGRREGSNRLYYHRDHLGSTRAVVNASGSVVQSYDYYPFGLEMPGRSMTSGSTARERFTGHERDEEVGLDYMQARRYAAEFGRFLGVDPMAGEMPSWNPYHYTFNNPINLIDPLGLMPQDPEELRRFQFDELGDGLAFMWQLSLSGTDNAVEVSAYLVKQSNGEVALVVFDNENNTLFTSDNPSIIDGNYNGELVVAQVHTHPAHPDKSDGNPARFSPDDLRLANNIPVFTIGAGGTMASTVGEGTTMVHRQARQWLSNRDNEGFLQTVINRRKEQQ